MIKLSKKTKYAILAMQLMASNGEQMFSAKEVAEKFHLSFVFISKILQSLKVGGLINSQKGVKGGYEMICDPNHTTVADIIAAMEEKKALVDCFDSKEDICLRYEECTLRGSMEILQKEIENVFGSMTLADLAKNMLNKNTVKYA
mgnify:CR=1 FL=1